ncbi:MAG: peptidoglycan DD-metalloendopeptidase family protein [Gammaproteobacteria bacterium]|jgi:murein DD-endopeptidase MepM/ murein hydrolase activator NlpD|nr:peptidoglycan DD-metalloendopeptidase family protein [Gammaproteobacteria bacterium]
MQKATTPSPLRAAGQTSVFLLVIMAAALVAGGIGFWLGKYRIAEADLAAAARTAPPPAADPSAARAAADIDAVAARVGALQAEIMRINALGQRLVEMAGLDEEEFDFANPAPAGGPDEAVLRKTSVENVEQDLAKVLSELDDRKRKLVLLETLIMERDLKRHSTPEGWPLRIGGVVTSKFGYRRHPITGRRSMHKGIDIAAKHGTDIVAMADGIVIFSGRKGGYGKIVEVRHANGLETRYAHNHRNLVTEGDMVRKGQVIAKLGSTGRSTGPHIHFEVRRNGEAVNPMQYLDLSKKSRVARL